MCCLASLNLETWFEWKDDRPIIADIMGFIDRAPEEMERAKYSAMRERSAGLGVMGFHGFLQAQGVPLLHRRFARYGRDPSAGGKAGDIAGNGVAGAGADHNRRTGIAQRL